MPIRKYLFFVLLAVATGCATQATSPTPAQKLIVAPKSMRGDSDWFVIPANIPQGSDVAVSCIVLSDDSPAKIAERVGVTLNDLKVLNPLADFDHLKVGQMILIYKGSVQSYVKLRSPNKAPLPGHI